MRRILGRLRSLLGRRKVDADVSREIAFHLQMEIEERRRRGLDPAEARRTTLRDFGGVERVREEVRDTRGLTFWDSLIQDTRFGLRLLVRQPNFSVVAVLVLALGIGANTAMFSLVNALLLKPRPGHATGELVGVFSRDSSQPDAYRAFSWPGYLDVRDRTDVFAAVASHTPAMVGVGEGQSTRQAFIDIVSRNFFDTFGVSLDMGRTFTAEEERPGANVPVVVLSYVAWQRLGGGPDVLGRSVRINGRDFTVIGVAPRNFGGSMVFVAPELFLPTGVYDTIANDFVRGALPTGLADRRQTTLMLIARLQPGASAASIGPALATVSSQLERAYPVDNAHQVIEAYPLARLSVSTSPDHESGLAGVTAGLLGMSGIVLLVASFNLANMLLARGGARRKEFAIRLAIGGSRSRLVRQLLTEGLVLSLVGGAAGLLLAMISTRLLVNALAAFSPVALMFDPVPDARVLIATLVFCALSVGVFGLLPAWQLSRTNAAPELKEQPADLRGPRGRRLPVRNLLVMGQLALSLVLLSVAGLFARGAMQAAVADPGFSFDRGVLVQIGPGLAGYDEARSREIDREVVARLRARSDVRAAALATIIPFGDTRFGAAVQLAGQPILPGDARAAEGLVDATFTSITSGYFDALGLSLEAGRDFTAAEELQSGGPGLAIIDRPLARRLFGDENPIGREIQYQRRSPAAPVVMRVVGISPGIRDDFFSVDVTPHLYVPLGQQFQTGVFVHVRTSAATAEAEAALLPGFRREIASVDAGLPILSIETLPTYRDRNLELSIVRMGSQVFLAFGAIALFLAAVGVYGVKSYLVSRRTREIGIRLALGATPGGVVWLIVRDGLVTSVVGLVVGLGLGALAGAAMRNMTYQGTGADAVVLATALAVLAAAAFLASWLPARRATRVSPLRAIGR
jgi:putative ABC transport system permease protein